MKKLINYLFYLSMILASVLIFDNIISFSEKLIAKDSRQLSAEVKRKKMLEPVVKITHIVTSNRTSPTGDIESNPYEIRSMSSATGFSVEYSTSHNQSIIVTNDHFCRNISENSILIFENYNGIKVDYEEVDTKSRVISTFPELDICLLLSRSYIRPATIKSYGYAPMPFEKVYIVGGPAGDFPIILDTYVSALMPRKSIKLGRLSSHGNDFILVSEQIFPGHSGSPIYTEDGDVVGVVFGALQTYGGLGVGHRDLLDTLYPN